MHQYFNKRNFYKSKIQSTVFCLIQLEAMPCSAPFNNNHKPIIHNCEIQQKYNEMQLVRTTYPVERNYKLQKDLMLYKHK